MAKWGEGDPRWLVEERPDATNVNNWHWSEKNASHWSKEKLAELLVGTKIETDFAECEIVEISKCAGDAVVNNRKAKLIFFYEWDMEMKWKGALVNGETEVKGTIQVPNLSEEHAINEVDITILLDTAGPESDILKDMMRSIGVEIIREKLSAYLTTLKEEFSKGLILPTKETGNSEITQTEKLNKNNEVFDYTSVKSSNSVETVETTVLKSTESFKCTAEEFYRAMTVKELVQAFTKGNSVLEAVEGGKFELFDGNVEGYFIKLVPNKTIVQKWRIRNWPAEHFSDVVMNIEEKLDCTEVHISQFGIPRTELENTCDGWKRFYWESMKRTFGFGALLF